MRNSKIPTGKVLGPQFIQKVLNLHSHENYIDNNGQIFVREHFKIDGKWMNEWHNLTGHTMKQLKDWLGY